MNLYRLLSYSSHLNSNFQFIITFTFVHHLMYIYIYTHTCVVLCYVYLLEVKGMKGCEALKYRFLFCGIESFFNFFSLYLSETHSHTYIYIHTLLSLSLCVVALSSVVSFFLYRSFTFSLLLFAASVFAITLWKRKDGSCTQYIKLKMEA